MLQFDDESQYINKIPTRAPKCYLKIAIFEAFVLCHNNDVILYTVSL